MAQTSPNHSPMPAIRNRSTLSQQPDALLPARSPVPTPRRPHCGAIKPESSLQRLSEISPIFPRRIETTPVFPRRIEVMPVLPRRIEITPVLLRRAEGTPDVRRRIEPSPDVRRRTEPPRVRNLPQPQVNRLRVEPAPSPTAQLIHKLFRNRDPRLLPDPSEISPLTPTNSRRASPRLPQLHIEEEIVYSEIPTAPIPIEPDDESDSEYLSIDNLSLNLNFDSLRTESITPPPAYRSIFDDDK